MRVECESCKQLVAATFAVDGGAIVATCSACHAATRVTPAPPAPAEIAAVCPKCGAPRKGDAACGSCGLAAGHMAAYTDTRDAAVPEPVKAAWQRVLERWDDPARHDELIRLASSHELYAWAAARYREAGRARQGDPVTDRQLERIKRAAEARLFVSGTPRKDDPATKPYRSAMAILGVLVVVIAMGLVYAMVFHEDHADVPAAPKRFAP